MSKQSPPCYVARFSYKPQVGRDINCIEITPGDILEVNDSTRRDAIHQGWMFGKNRRSQTSGYFPCKQFVDIVNDNFDGNVMDISSLPNEGGIIGTDSNPNEIFLLRIERNFSCLIQLLLSFPILADEIKKILKFETDGKFSPISSVSCLSLSSSSDFKTVQLLVNQMKSSDIDPKIFKEVFDQSSSHKIGSLFDQNGLLFPAHVVGLQASQTSIVTSALSVAPAGDKRNFPLELIQLDAREIKLVACFTNPEQSGFSLYFYSQTFLGLSNLLALLLTRKMKIIIWKMIKGIISTTADTKLCLEFKWSEKDESRLLSYLEFLSSSNKGFFITRVIFLCNK